MPTVQEDILNVFYAKLSKLCTVDQPTIDALRKTLASAKKLKVDDFVAILTNVSKDTAL